MAPRYLHRAVCSSRCFHSSGIGGFDVFAPPPRPDRRIADRIEIAIRNDCFSVAWISGILRDDLAPSSIATNPVFSHGFLGHFRSISGASQEHLMKRGAPGSTPSKGERLSSGPRTSARLAGWSFDLLIYNSYSELSCERSVGLIYVSRRNRRRARRRRVVVPSRSSRRIP